MILLLIGIYFAISYDGILIIKDENVDSIGFVAI